MLILILIIIIMIIIVNCILLHTLINSPKLSF